MGEGGRSGDARRGPWRVLFTNNTLALRAGTELWVRDFATALLGRGHRPVAYSDTLGPVAEELRLASVPVVDDLARLAEPPDLIHGHHHLETMTALLGFPSAPVIFFCHGFIPWQETPPRHPRILRYVAVDEPCRDRLTQEHGIPPERVRMLLNCVDTVRFRPRGSLPERPGRALILENSTEGDYVEAVREACRRREIALEVVGASAGRVCDRPESLLPEYDLVFATGRSAIEAMAVGCAVIICHQPGIGPMVAEDRFDELRPLNFGLRALRGPISVEGIVEQIDRYDPAGAAAVSRRIREEANLDSAVVELEELYAEVLAESDSQARPRGAREASAYLRSVAGRIKELERICSRTRDLEAEAEALRREAASLHAGIAQRDADAEAERAALCDELDRRRAEVATLQGEKASLEERLAAAERHEEALRGLRRRFDRLSREAAKSRFTLQRVFGSRSWRWTAALRGLRHRLRARGASTNGGMRPPAPFIVGVPRSGTTLLRTMLDAHPLLCIPPETGFLIHLDDLDPADPEFPRRFVTRLSGFETWPDFLLDEEELLAALSGNGHVGSTADAARTFFDLCARELGKRRWGDKTPLYGLHLDKIRRLLPEARFLHVIRDGRDVACSVKGHWFPPGESAAEVARDWRDRILATRRLAAGAEDYLEVRYERLVTEPEAVLREICDFIRLSFDGRMLEYPEHARVVRERVVDRLDADGNLIVSREDRLAHNRLLLSAPDPSRIGRWRNDLSTEEVQEFEGEAGALLELLGYPLSTARGTEPGR